MSKIFSPMGERKSAWFHQDNFSSPQRPNAVMLAVLSLMALFLLASGSWGDISQGQRDFGLDRKSSRDQPVSTGGFSFFRNDRVKNGVLIVPNAAHTTPPYGTSRINFVGAVYKSLTFGRFDNSYGNQTFFLGQTKNLVSARRVGVDYFYGLMHGYNGILGRHSNVPQILRPLFVGPLNPVVAVSPFYAINEKLELRAIASPLFVGLGLKVNF